MVRHLLLLLDVRIMVLNEFLIALLHFICVLICIGLSLMILYKEKVLLD
jgi:cytochrome bd-type quinol oxidase subunit 1